MSQRGPGRAERRGVSIVELFRMFPDDEAAEKWFEDQRWPNGQRFCPDCGSLNYAVVTSRKPMPYRCRDCRQHFSVRKGSVMLSSPLGLQTWIIAIYMMSTGIKGTSSMKLHRELKITQKTAWHLMQRIREGFNLGVDLPMPGPVEIDETYIGGKRAQQAPIQETQGRSRGCWQGCGSRGQGPRHKYRQRYCSRGHGCKDAARFRDRAHCRRCDCLHRRPQELSRASQDARDGQALRERVCERVGAYKRNRELLVAVQARLLRHLSPHEPQTFEPLR